MAGGLSIASRGMRTGALDVRFLADQRKSSDTGLSGAVAEYGSEPIASATTCAQLAIKFGSFSIMSVGGRAA